MEQYINGMKTIEGMIISRGSIDEQIDKILLKESTLCERELYQLLVDSIIYNKFTDDSIENYLYYWAFGNDDLDLAWRKTISSPIMDQIAMSIHDLIKIIEMDVPELMSILGTCDNNCIVTLHKTFAVLRF